MLAWLHNDTASALLGELASGQRNCPVPGSTSYPTASRCGTCAACWSPPVRAAIKWDGPTRPIDNLSTLGPRPACCTNPTSKPPIGKAGLLVLLYAQWPAAISRLTLDRVHTDEDNVLLRLGRGPIVLPEPRAALTRELVGFRHSHASLGDQGTSRWLFPGGRPGRPISAEHLDERLRQLGSGPDKIDRQCCSA